MKCTISHSKHFSHSSFVDTPYGKLVKQSNKFYARIDPLCRAIFRNTDDAMQEFISQSYTNSKPYVPAYDWEPVILGPLTEYISNKCHGMKDAFIKSFPVPDY